MTESIEERCRLLSHEARWNCDPASLDFTTTDDIPTEERIYGQENAVDALRYGLETRVHGHNIFVRGLSGLGRMSLIHQMIEEIKPSCTQVPDRCYVRNFSSPDQARLITIASGTGHAFRSVMDKFVHFVEHDLAAHLASDRVKARQKQLEESTQEEIKKIGLPFDEELKSAGLAMVPIQIGQNMVPAISPVIEGKPKSYEEIQQLRTEGKISDDEFKSMMDKIVEMEKKVAQLGHDVTQAQTRHRDAIISLMTNEAKTLIHQQLDPIRSDFPGDDVSMFLDEITQDLLEHRLMDLTNIAQHSRNYRVNLVLGHEVGSTCPVISEPNPTLSNLLGKIDREFSPNNVVAHSDHMMIKPGVLLQADGGFLILDAQEILMEPGAWSSLLRTLKTGLYEISSADPLGLWAMQQLKPEPIPVDLKVVLVGDPDIYYLLDSAEPRFPHLFKILADFSDTLPRDETGIHAYTKVIARIIRKDKLLRFDTTGVARVIEHGARICGQQNRLTSRFARIADIAREASYCAIQIAKEAGVEATTVNAEAVRAAISQARRRADIPARNFQRLVAERTLKIEVSGKVVGQINGLAVTQAGPLTYGFPTRITASIGPGSAGVTNIERESDLSGALHTKAFFILGGVMRHLLKLDHPMAFSASIAFEQTYGGIDGDSASGAEFCCLMSALTDIPINQGLAMTGAIDQKGNILPIGAATEKIEGYYSACKSLGFSGSQGVLIPRSNARDLMLRDDVLDSMEKGEFNVYAVETIQEALNLLTGVPAGERNDRGYSAGSVLGMAEARSRRFWEVAKASRG